MHGARVETATTRSSLSLRPSASLQTNTGRSFSITLESPSASSGSSLTSVHILKPASSVSHSDFADCCASEPFCVFVSIREGLGDFVAEHENR